MTKPVLLIGEAWGENEAKLKLGFVGASGIELLRMLDEAGVIELTPGDRNRISLYYRTGDANHIAKIWEGHEDEIIRTNVFNLHPPSNRLEHLCGPKAEGLAGYGPLIPSKYVRDTYESELNRLGDEILELDPNLIVLLGNTPVWAMTGKTGVTKLRGTTVLSTHCVADYKCLVTYHPSAVLRQYEIRPTTIADLSKIKNEAASASINRPPCEIWIEPGLDDIETFIARFVHEGNFISCDIETSGTRITCIGLGPRRDLAIVIPFDDERKPTKSYWPDAATERCAWELLRPVLENPTIFKTFQNGLYDIAFLIRSYGIRVMGTRHDTMLLHHALQPESLKGLGYLGSIYTDHGPWKSERKHSETIKRDE